MRFRYAPHNFYLNFWFNLGIVGLASGIYLLAAPVRAARAAIEHASPQGRVVLIAFSIATIAFATSLFFVDVLVPWLYYFAYAGLAMRIAVNATESVHATAPVGAIAPSPAGHLDRFGWARSATR
jgi:O-antigen ligase